MDYFPMGLAKGKAFCNRVEEQKRLKQHIEQCRHTLINSPRRYGKSSLVQKVLDEAKLPYEKIDLSLAYSLKSINDYFLSAAERLLIALQPSHKKAFEMAKQTLKHLKPKLIFDEIGAKIELNFQKKTPRLQQLKSTLSALDKVAKETKKKAILYIDEFQQIATLQNHQAIEAAIRSAAQEFEMVMLIFTGSNRKLLVNMFDDGSRPFFQLCEKISLDRISNNDYVKHLQELAKIRWGAMLSDVAIEKILSLTECHPYYVNFLCSKIWNSEKLPTDNIVMQEWQHCLEEEWHLLTMTIISLSQVQKSILELLVNEPIDKPMSKKVSAKLHVTPRAISKAFNSLVDNDLIYKDQEGFYHLINPLMKLYVETLLKLKN